MAPERKEQIVVEEELTSYASESAARGVKAARPALTVAGAAVGRRKGMQWHAFALCPISGNWTINGRSLKD